jgi:hypothetical protein
MAIDHQVSPQGVHFRSRDGAKSYADHWDMDLVESANGEWLAANRTMAAGPMPTKQGDTVIRHVGQMFRVWVVTWDGARSGDPNVQALDLRTASEAQDAARNWAQDGTGRIFHQQRDGGWRLTDANGSELPPDA